MTDQQHSSRTASGKRKLRGQGDVDHVVKVRVGPCSRPPAVADNRPSTTHSTSADRQLRSAPPDGRFPTRDAQIIHSGAASVTAIVELLLTRGYPSHAVTWCDVGYQDGLGAYRANPCAQILDTSWPRDRTVGCWNGSLTSRNTRTVRSAGEWRARQRASSCLNWEALAESGDSALAAVSGMPRSVWMSRANC